MPISKHKGIRLTAKVLGGTVTVIVLLFFLLKGIIAVPAVQKKLKHYATNSLEQQLNCDVTIGSFHVSFPKKLVISTILIKNFESDTLFLLDKFAINVRILPLLRHKITIQKIELTEGEGNFGKLLAQIPPTDDYENSNNDSETKPWEIAINKLKAESCYFVYSDASKNGFDLILDIGELKIDLGMLDFDTLIFCETFDANNTYVDLVFPASLAAEEIDTSSAGFADIRIAKVRLENAGFFYADTAGAYSFNVRGDKVDINNLLVGINNSIVAINKGYALNTSTRFFYLPVDTANAILAEPAETADNSWRIQGGELELDHFLYSTDYIGQPDPPGHINPNHIRFNDLRGKISGFVVHGDTLRADIKNLSGREKNGFSIQKLNATIQQEESVFSVPEFSLTTNNATYDLTFMSDVVPGKLIESRNKKLALDLRIQSENWKDIDYLYPFLDSTTFLKNGFSENEFEIHTNIHGTIDSLFIEDLNIHYLDDTELLVDGSILNLINPDHLRLDLNIEKLDTKKSDLEYTLKNLESDSAFSLPDKIKFHGNYHASSGKHFLSGLFDSDIGTVHIAKANADFGPSPFYFAEFTAHLSNLQSVTNNGLEQIALHAVAEFSGNDIYTSEGAINLTIDSLRYKQYTYHNSEIDVAFNEGNLQTSINSLDTNLLLACNAQGFLSQTEKLIHAEFDLKNADLFRLNLFKEDFKFTGKSELTFSLAKENDLSLGAAIQSLDFYFSDTIYHMHPIEIQFLTNNYQTAFNLESYYYNLTASFNDYIKNIPGAIKNLPFYYLNDRTNDSADLNLPEFTIKGKLDYPEAFARLFFPGLPSFKRLTVDGGYDKGSALTFTISLPGFQYKDIFADSLSLGFYGNSDVFNYKSVTTLEIGDLMKGKLDISGSIENSQLLTNLVYYDSFKNQYLNLKTSLFTNDNHFIVQILPEELIFSYDRWNINPENQVIIGPSSLGVKDFNLTCDLQKISITSYPESSTENIRLQLQDFALGSLEQLFADDTLVAGFADADFVFYNLFSNPSIEGDLTIEETNLYDVDIGTFSMPKFAYNKDGMTIKVDLNGEHDDIDITGNLIKNHSNKNIEADLKIRQLDFEQLNYLLSDYVYQSKGNIKGDLKIQGDMKMPMLNGQLSFNEASVGLKSLNNSFALGKETIEIKNNRIHFDDFTIVNQEKQSAKITGTISPDPSGKAYQDLRIVTDDMVLMNSTKEENSLLYGLLQAQTNIEIKGLPGELKTTANINVDNTTHLNYVFPDALKLNDSKGIVLYDRYQPDSINSQDNIENSSLFRTQFLNTVRAEISFEPGVQLKLFFDEEGYDYLDASLDGLANYNIYQGITDISGNIAITGGKLHYAIPMVSVNEYEIEPGSYISLSNDLYNPNINLNASAYVRASTEGLIADYHKVMNFKILLKMTGELNNLKLIFDISPETSETSDPVVSARLAQLSETERNVNALNLLVRGTFTFDLHSAEAGSASSAEAQIDKFYANHLNHLISENIQFVDLHFDVQSYRDYNSSGDIVFQRNYYYNVGKSLYNDRARINYKGSLGVTSDLQSEQVNSQFVQNELEFEVKFTDDGAYRGVFFRKNKYEGILEGEVIETGGGIRIQKGFYSIKDMFIKEENELEPNKKKQKKNNNKNQTDKQ